MIGLPAYANDIAILEDNIEIAKKHFKKLIEAARKVSVIINDNKTKTVYLKLSRRD